MNHNANPGISGSATAVLLVGSVLSACATTPPPNDFCESPAFLVDHHFEGGNFHRCTVDANNVATIHIRPEDEGRINPSPWYAFRVTPKTGEPVSVRVDFGDTRARYRPKISENGSDWREALPSEARQAEGENAWQLSIASDAPGVWIAGQELLTTGWYDDWIREIVAKDAVDVSLLGRSVEGRPLFVAQTKPRREVVYLIGRQHPPEVTGALAMRPFVDTVLADTALAREFRERYMLVIIPLINPDGVAHGHWRHNMYGVDLNRDWGTFTQPETQAAARLVDALDAAGHRPALMLDFHSTRASLFYTQLPEESSWPIDFATVWFQRFRARRPDFEFRHEPRPRSGQANTKNFFFDRYRIPAYTYEIGDEEDRGAIADTTPVFAEEMMRLMLEYSEEKQVSRRGNPAAADGRAAPLPLPADSL